MRAPDSGSEPVAASPRPARGRRRAAIRGLLVVLVVLASGTGGGALVASRGWPSFVDGIRADGDVVGGIAPVPSLPGPAVPADPAAPSTGAAGPGSAAPGAPSDRPTPGVGSSPSRLGIAPPAPVGGGPHVFVAFQANGATPVAYDPCRPVHYVIRPDSAPDGGEAMIHAAVARVSQATGLQFVHDGATDEQLTGERRPFQPDRYGDRWAPVLIGWQTEAENPALAGDVVGQGGSIAVSLGDGPRVYVTGTVALDADQFPDILGTRDGRATATGVILHELAHVVGLAHVDDERQLMHPETRSGVSDFAGGDLTGLSRLGRGVCAPEL